MKRSSQNSNRKTEYNESQGLVHIAVDVSKDILEILHPIHGAAQINNTQASILPWLRRLQKQTPHLQVVCEASGGYEKPLIACCWELNCPVIRVNPRWIRHFAKSKGLLAKTDALDARVILDFARKADPSELSPLQPPPKYQQELRELVDRRDNLKHMLQQEKNRLEKNPSPFVARSINSMIHSLQKQIDALEARLQALQDQCAELDRRVKRLCQIQAIASKSAWSLLGHMPELGSLSDKEAAALAGVAPYPDDSGKHRGKRHILHGRAAVRRTLYMCAVASTRHNPILRDFYQRLKLAGKPSKVALTALMRKLIILCNRALKDPHFQLA